MSRARPPAARCAALLLLLALPAAAQEAPAPERHDLRPRYAEGERWEAEASLSLLLDLRLSVPSVDLERTSQQEQRVRRRSQSRVRAARDGAPLEVERRYLEAIVGSRDPGAPRLSRELHPLHQRRLILDLDPRGRLRVRVPKDAPPLAESAAEDEVLTERYEAVLPAEPVAVGERWRIEGERLRRALGPGLGRDPTGAIECTLAAVREEALDEEAEPERYAVVALELAVAGRQGPEPDAPRLETRLRGELYFSLAHRKLAAVTLRGEARLHQTRREEGHVLELEGRGPVEIVKRAWFPERPKRGDGGK